MIYDNMRINTAEQKNLKGNINKICLINFFDGLWFPGSVFVIFLLANGMNLNQVGLIFASSSIMPFFFDIPSSLWADRYSRKSMLILSWIAYLAMNTIYLFSHSFPMFFIAFFLNGVGTALSAVPFLLIFVMDMFSCITTAQNLITPPEDSAVY